MNNQRIHQLSTHLANQIAAGEVVERPASVLKEILENSLDANSTQIDITLERGGIGLIRVQDNGTGICKEDLELALAPHATSKIKTLSDLEGVASYGFRGEALASISAVSRLELSSSVSEQETGFCVRIEGRNSQPTIFPVAKRLGTCVEVKDLFYNTPARRKFLKSEKTEMAYLEEVFKRVALSQPEVAFKFQSGEKVEKRLPACKSIEAQTRRVALLCGKSFVEHAYYMQAESNGLKLYGWLGSAEALRAQADLQYFYVNGRIVRDKLVSHAIRQAYQKICLPGRYPAYVLYFELDPSAVDVNVHPTKHEVRFREARTVHAFLSYAIQEGLEFKNASDSGSTDNSENTEKTIAKAKQNSLEFAESSETTDQRFFVSHKTDTTDLSELGLKMQPHRYLRTPQQQLFSEVSFQISDKKPEKEQHKISVKPEIKPDMSIERGAALPGRPLCILENEFLLLESNNELVIVDIKRLRKEMIKRGMMEFYNNNGIPKRPFLMPKTIIVGDLVERAESEQLDWQRLGFEWSQVGENSILVRAVPELFGSTIENLNELLQKILKISDPESCIHLISNHYVETHKLSLEEATGLLEQFEKLTIIEKEKFPINFYKRVPLGQLRLLFNNV